MILIVDNFTPFIGTVNANIMCVPIPCMYQGALSYFVPDGWQEDLNAKNINYQLVNENGIELPTQNSIE